MKYVKMLGLVAMAAAALMAFAGSAAATTLTAPTGTAAAKGTLITAVNTGGHVTLHGSFGVKVECSSHVAGTITNNGAGNVTGSLTALSFSNCTNGYTVTVLGSLGTLSIDSTKTLRGSGQTITVHTPLGIACEYTTNNTALGTVTDSHTTGGNAVLDISATIPRTGDSFLCGSTGQWTGKYAATSPAAIYID